MIFSVFVLWFCHLRHIELFISAVLFIRIAAIGTLASPRRAAVPRAVISAAAAAVFSPRRFGIIAALRPCSGFSVIIFAISGRTALTRLSVAAVILTVLPEMLRGFDEYRMLLYSIILIAVMLFKPSGLLGRYEISVPGLFMKLWNKLKHPKQKTTGEA